MKRAFVVASTTAIAGVISLCLARIWGSTAAERRAFLPGDAHVDWPDAEATHGVTIDAPAESIWPWLTQIGQDRGGFYSYTALENVIGCDVTDVHTLREEWSTRHEGEAIRLAPEISLRVLESSPGRALVFAEGAAVEGETRPWAVPTAFSWAFIVVPHGEYTRLVVRERYRFRTGGERLFGHVVTAASCVMTGKMLRTIRKLAEASSSL